MSADDSPVGDSRIWELWVDTGGTFTDCLFRLENGQRRRLKVLSSSALRGRVLGREGGAFRVDLAERTPDGFFVGYRCGRPGTDSDRRVVDDRDGLLRLEKEGMPDLGPGDACELRSPEAAPVLAARWATGCRLDQPLPAWRVRLATTRGTNALLERRGRPPCLFVTRGFEDLLEIADQQRPDLFALQIDRRQPLHARVVGVAARHDAGGNVVEALSPRELRPAIDEALEAGIRNAAVSLLHGYLDGDMERELGDYLRRRGFEHVSMGSELAPLIGYLARTETAVVDSYLAPVLEEYFRGVEKGLEPKTLHLMTSAGGLVARRDFRACDGLLSGPSGGVVGAARAGRLSGFGQLLTFDMGGTSTDVARWSGELEYVYEVRVGDARLVAPSVSIETVAAGGGSVCSAEDGLPKVGPESAGARPGPACYGAGGPLTLTDVNLLLGRLDEDRFGIPIDRRAAQRALAALEDTLGVAGERLLAGFLAIADERMAEAIRRISIRRGYDPETHTLVAFGGAGGQHACSVAKLLGVPRILSPRDAGLLSALGLGAAPVERFAQEQILEVIDSDEELWRRSERLQERASRALAREGFAPEDLEIRRRLVRLRLAGQETPLELDLVENVAAAFREAYRDTYGYLPPADQSLEVESMRVVASSRVAEEDLPATARTRDLELPARRRAFLEGRWHDVVHVERDHLEPGDRLAGPALIFDDHTTLVVDRSWRAEKDAAGAVVLVRSEGLSRAPQSRDEPFLTPPKSHC